MKFKTTELVEFFDDCGDYELGALEGATVVDLKQIETRRWESIHRAIFKVGDKLYQTHIRRPLTESQETEDCGYFGEEQECPEVEAYEQVITDYRVVA